MQKLYSFLKKKFRPAAQAPVMPRSFGLQEELRFWREWFLTGGLDWPDDFRSRFDPEQPLHKHISVFVDRLDIDCVHILDVGSGPLTKLGKKHPSKQLVITATDFLASEYDRLLAEMKIKPLIRTIYADAEKLVEQFGQNTFDIVHGENCVDHMVDPLKAIEQMVAVSKSEGYVVLYHMENEGEHQHYYQLHQWNFTVKNGSFIMSDRWGRKINASKKLEKSCEIECIRDGDKIRTVIRKKIV